jgi:hypothetical protein
MNNNKINFIDSSLSAYFGYLRWRAAVFKKMIRFLLLLIFYMFSLVYVPVNLPKTACTDI